MILPPPPNHATALSAWAAGIMLLFVAIGLSGAAKPLKPETPALILPPALADAVMLEEFEPPPPPGGPPAEISPPEDAEPDVEAVEVEIPPVPEISAPLTPPEVMEILPLETAAPRVKPDPAPAPAVRPRPSPVRAPVTTPDQGSLPSSPPGSATGEQGGTGTVARAGGGKGKFPQPLYPAAARRAKQQGTVMLAITVEASGLPASVSVATSSGYPALDAAARDGVQRRWRWPAGGLRKFTVPIRFVLK